MVKLAIVSSSQSLPKMESATIKSKNMEQIQTAIQQLIESKRSSATEADDSADERQLLSKLLSQMESMIEEEEVANQSDPLVEQKEVPSGRACEAETNSKDETETSKNKTGVEAEAVVKELKKLEKQNRTTHWLLSALIILTVAWQVSEVSLLLKMKEGLTHPFRSLGSLVVGLVKRRRQVEEEADNSSLLAKVNGSENPLKLPNVDIARLINGDGE